MIGMDPELELYLLDKHDCWSTVFNQISREAKQRYELSYSDARRIEFRSRNRYKDINPFDHSRIKIEYNNIDYINASRVEVPEAKKSYILTQGPLAITVGHFWLMCWEKQAPCIVMLNKLIEKKQVKCHPYFPIRTTKPLTLKDSDLKITLISRVGDDGVVMEDDEDPSQNCIEDVAFISQCKKQFIISHLRMDNLKTSEQRHITHFHYTSWPDFGIPESPEIFLRFLFTIRNHGCLDDTTNHPPVIHCSAGVGRSGAFSLVDACLSIAESDTPASNINIRSILLNMRRYRMGLIQTPPQLKFSYQAIVEGLKILNLLETNRNLDELSKEAEQQYLSRLASFEKEDEDTEDDSIFNKVKTCYPKSNRNRNHRVSFGRIVPHAASIEDPDYLWFLNNDAFNGEPVLIRPGQNGDDADDEFEEDDNDDGFEYGVRRDVRVVEEDMEEYNSDGDDLDEEDDEEKLEFVSDINIQRKPLEERRKKSEAEIALMRRRQEESGLFIERRKKQFKMKLIGWSIIVVVISIAIYRWVNR